MEPKAVTTSYARWAPIYDRTFGAITNVGRKRAVTYINALPVDKVLEVGVGTGLALPHYRGDLSVYGFDYSVDMLAKAQAKVAEQGLAHVKELRQMDARALDYADDSFDAVAAMHVISVVPEPEKVMAEIARVCRPGGKIVITNHFARQSGFLSVLERMTAPFDSLLGWHSDFDIGVVLGQPGLRVVERAPLPPFGMMTFLVLQKDG